MVFRGSLATSSDFPDALSRHTGDFYIVTGDVTDSVTGQSFTTDDEIVWNGTS
jgi:hypothetical protein